MSREGKVDNIILMRVNNWQSIIIGTIIAMRSGNGNYSGSRINCVLINHSLHETTFLHVTLARKQN